MHQFDSGYSHMKAIIVEKNDALKTDLPKIVPLTKNFNSKNNPKDIIGIAECFLEDGMIKANLILRGHDEFQKTVHFKRLSIDGWPAIAGRVIEREGSEIKKFAITEVSICSVMNCDESIKKISEQIKEIQR